MDVGYFLRKHLIKLGRRDLSEYRKHLTGLYGLEVGGPSPSFYYGGVLPIYDCIGGLECANFSTSNIWQGAIGETFKYGERVGRQYIADATNLSVIPSGKYDFVLSSHMLEHCANPLKAMEEMLRVIKDDGLVLSIIPYKKWTFDHKRPLTPFSHLLEDYKNNVDETDLSHVEEVIRLYDYTMDDYFPDFKEFIKRCMNNVDYRQMHQHTFNLKTVLEAYNYFNIETIKFNVVSPVHIIVLGRKGGPKNA